MTGSAERAPPFFQICIRPWNENELEAQTRLDFPLGLTVLRPSGAGYTDKKENKISSSYIGKFRWNRVQSYTVYEEGLRNI
jgi:hypothetical protein